MKSPVRQVHPPSDSGFFWFLVAMVLVGVYLLFSKLYEVAGIIGIYIVCGVIVSSLAALVWALIIIYEPETIRLKGDPPGPTREERVREALLSGASVFSSLVLAEIIGWPTFVAMQTLGLRGVLYFLGGFMVSVFLAFGFWWLVCWLIETRLFRVVPFLAKVVGLPLIVGIFGLAFRLLYR